MPFIEVNASCGIDDTQEKIMKEQLGQAIEILPDMKEAYLMLLFRDHCRIYFRGSNEQKTAFVIVKRFGAIPALSSNALTGRISEILEKTLGVLPENTYIQYEEVPYWGCRGRNL